MLRVSNEVKHVLPSFLPSVRPRAIRAQFHPTLAAAAEERYSTSADAMEVSLSALTFWNRKGFLSQ